MQLTLIGDLSLRVDIPVYVDMCVCACVCVCLLARACIRVKEQGSNVTLSAHSTIF